jgi:DNA helicase IV
MHPVVIWRIPVASLHHQAEPGQRVHVDLVGVYEAHVLKHADNGLKTGGMIKIHEKKEIILPVYFSKSVC